MIVAMYMAIEMIAKTTINTMFLFLGVIGLINKFFCFAVRKSGPACSSVRANRAAIGQAPLYHSAQTFATAENTGAAGGGKIRLPRDMQIVLIFPLNSAK